MLPDCGFVTALLGLFISVEFRNVCFLQDKFIRRESNLRTSTVQSNGREAPTRKKCERAIEIDG